MRRAAIMLGLVALGVCLLISFAHANELHLPADIRQAVEITDHGRRLEQLEAVHADQRLVKLETIGERNNTLLVGLAIAIAPIAFHAILGLKERAKG
jgi:hypothetical protein